jgi:alpha-glucosidase
VWDESVVLDGAIGDYIITARRKGDCWYVGGMTDWSARSVAVDLSKLGIAAGSRVELFCDGAKADKVATDYDHKYIDLPADGVINIDMAPGGGFMMVIK